MMMMKPLAETATSWGLNDSTLRKQVGKRFEGRLYGHTLFIDAESEAFLTWLREHVLSQRQRGRWPALVELAALTFTHRSFPQGTTRYAQATLQQPLEALIWTLRQESPVEGAVLAERSEQARQQCEDALDAFVARPDIVSALCSLFFRLLNQTYGGSVQELLKQERLLLFAFAVYQEEALQEQAAIFSGRAEDTLALGDEPVRAGEHYAIQVAGYRIEGRAAFDAHRGWHLVTSDESVILLRPNMRGWPLRGITAQPNRETS